jgi:hypothetical protein
MTDLTPDDFRERFALAAFSDGGVVVDLATGSYSRLNATGASMLASLAAANTTAAAIADIASRYHIPPALCAEHLAELARALAREGLRQEPADPFRYRPAADGGYDLWHGSRIALHVDSMGKALRTVTPFAELPLKLFDYVSGIAPKLLFLRGATVLHGSSCIRHGALLGICGKSRAGKTTTARTFARHGSRLISEDLLVMSPDLADPGVFVDGEKRVKEWSLRATVALEASAWGESAAIEPLLDAMSGPTVPLASLWFLDAARRGERMAMRRLDRSQALTMVMANQFLGASGHENWRRHLQSSCALAGSISAFELDLPNGLDRLDDSIRRYATNSAS